MIFINDMAWRVREEFQRNQAVWSSKFVWIVDKDVGEEIYAADVTDVLCTKQMGVQVMTWGECREGGI